MLDKIKISKAYNVGNLPKDWRYDGVFPMPCGEASIYSHKTSSLAVLVSIDELDYGKTTLHVSLSRKNKLPDWKDIVLVKNIFYGNEVQAYHIIPKQSEYVNLMSSCIHLWGDM